MKCSKTLFLLCCLSAVMSACIKSTHLPFVERSGDEQQNILEPGKLYQGRGQIVGLELAACMCCGGYWLKTAETDSVLCGKMPDNSGFDFDCNEQFPISVEYEIFTDSSICWQVKRYVTALSINRI